MNRENRDVYYIVRLKENFTMPLTTINREFCGKIVNQNGSNFYFELNGSDALVIIPHKEVEWLAPSKELWNI